MALLDPVSGAIFRDSIRELQVDVHRELHTSTYTLWMLDRPVATWDAGTAGEGWTQIGEGTCKLTEAGAGGPRALEGMWYPESPYQIRMLASAFNGLPRVAGSSDPDTAGTYLVLNGTRLFQVDQFKTEDERDLLGTAYCRELLDQPLPEETP